MQQSGMRRLRVQTRHGPLTAMRPGKGLRGGTTGGTGGGVGDWEREGGGRRAGLPKRTGYDHYRRDACLSSTDVASVGTQESDFCMTLPPVVLFFRCFLLSPFPSSPSSFLLFLALSLSYFGFLCRIFVVAIFTYFRFLLTSNARAPR